MQRLNHIDILFRGFVVTVRVSGLLKFAHMKNPRRFGPPGVFVSIYFLLIR